MKQVEPQIIMIKTESLIPYVMNSRTHSPEQVSQIAANIKEFGFTNPVLTDGENSIIAGHGRVLAAQKLGLEEVPCIELPYLTEAQRKAYIIADNKLALNAGWDNEVLKAEITTLKEMDYEIELLGFDSGELNLIFDGWLTKDPTKKDEPHLDGITTWVKISVSPEDQEFAKEKITNALDDAGIDYELK